jgi:hypothetical protein
MPTCRRGTLRVPCPRAAEGMPTQRKKKTLRKWGRNLRRAKAGVTPDLYPHYAIVTRSFKTLQIVVSHIA